MGKPNPFCCPKTLSARSRALWRATAPALGDDPPRHERKKIDGIVAAIMALDAADRTGVFNAGTSDGMVWYLDSEEEIERREESGLSQEAWDRQQAGREESGETTLYS